MKIRFRPSAEWDWRGAGLAIVFDPCVLFTGEDAIMRAWDIDILLLFLSIQLRWEWPVRRYGEGEHFLDAMLSYHDSPPSPS